MKRIFVLLFALTILCGCSTKNLTFNHNIIEADYRSGVEYPQIQLFRSYKELEDYSKAISEGIQDLPDNLFTHDRNFVETLKIYNKDYFQNNILIIVTISAGSGGDRFAIDGIIKSDDALTVNIRKTQSGMTCDMAAWDILLELDNSFATDAEKIKLEIHN